MEFLDERMLLESDLAYELYSSYAKEMPIIDYHSHLNPKEIAEDKAFYNLTELWLSGDHYKWRLMRNCGVDEKFITGNAEPKDKFRAFAKILPSCIGNAIYIWCHLELKTYFKITTPISEETADEIYDKTAVQMNDGSMSAKKLIKLSGVKALCTTDDPVDNLEYHQKIAKSGFETLVLPTFRPDKILNINLKTFVPYAKDLTNLQLPKFKDVLNSLVKKLDFFKQNGCFISDHALDNYTFSPCDEETAANIFSAVMLGKTPDNTQTEKFKTFMLAFLSKEYKKLGIAMQLHLCCIRNNNADMFNRLGPDTGFDAIFKSQNAEKLAKLLSLLKENDALPKTIVYSLDPDDNKVINSIINCFQQSGVKGFIQHGSAWWFNDTKFGMTSHLKTLCEYSVIGNFIGMLTDSRSFTSYVRHDYFRRILCNVLANAVLCGEYPNNKQALKAITQNICYNNAKTYFELDI